MSRGASYSTIGGSNAIAGDGTSVWDIVNFVEHTTGPISGLEFRCIDAINNADPSGNIRAGARVLVYGYEGLS